MGEIHFDTPAETAGLRINKRELLAGAGAAAALAMLPRISRAASETWDLIVVGGGSAGLPCAIFAAQQGARVLVVGPCPPPGRHAGPFHWTDCGCRNANPGRAGYRGFARGPL